MRPRQVAGLLAGTAAIEAGYVWSSMPIFDPIQLAFMATTMLFPAVLVYEMAGWRLRRWWATLAGVLASPVVLVASDVMSAERVFLLSPPEGYVGVDYTVLSSTMVAYLLITGLPVAAYILVNVLADARTNAGDGGGPE